MIGVVDYFFFFFKQKTAYEMRISDWSSDVCSSDLLPERMIAADPDHFLNRHLAGQIKVEGALDPRVVAEYRRCYRDPATRHAICEDYRDAASIDLDHDSADGKRRTEAPLLLLSGGTGTVGQLFDVLAREPVKARSFRARGVPARPRQTRTDDR